MAKVLKKKAVKAVAKKVTKKAVHLFEPKPVRQKRGGDGRQSSSCPGYFRTL